jgi:hypothetical protein
MPRNHSKKHHPEHHPHPSGGHVPPTPPKRDAHSEAAGGKHTESSSHSHPGDRNASHGRH